MKQAVYKDEAGRQWAVLLPDEAPESDAALGVPLGPPSLESLNLPEEVEVRLHNQLFARRLFAPIDVKRRRQDVFAALQAALSLDVERVVQLYLAPALEQATDVGGNGRSPRGQVGRKERRHA